MDQKLKSKLAHTLHILHNETVIKNSIKSDKKTSDVKNHLNNGLDVISVKKLQRQFGLNELPTKAPPSDIYFFFKQFQNPLIIVLLFAGIITTFLKEYKDTVIIFLAVLINSMLGFFQERKAYKSLESLKKVVTQTTLVIRDGKRQEIDVRELVVGDVVTLFEGDKVPADGVIFESNHCLIEEAILTGESVAVEKKPQKNLSTTEQIQYDEDSLTYMGTTILSGSCKILVTKTGKHTQIGQIAKEIEKNQIIKTPLEEKLANFAKQITILILCLSAIIFAVGLYKRQEPIHLFTTTVALSVAAIPEGLVIGLTAILAIGMSRILKRNGLVKNLLAAETLGSVTTVCVDKTGTLTEGKMQVVFTTFLDEKLGYKASILANDLKDPIEIARMQWAENFANKNKSYLNPKTLIQKESRIDNIPFSTERRFLAVQTAKAIYIAGAPEDLLTHSNIKNSLKNQFQKSFIEQAQKGRRLIGFAVIKTPNASEAKTIMSELQNMKFPKKETQWLGFMAFLDPVRTTAKETIKQTQNAGVKIKVITGDYSLTAKAVLSELGIKVTANQILEGKEMENMSQAELQKVVGHTILFARIKPKEKLRIVEALQSNNEVVAMMGDGVNDAPALSRADIGVVVSNASDVAKDASQLILLDSNMQTITSSIEEGRGMFENLKKVTFYLLSDSLSEIFIILIGILASFQNPISATQILWINLINDSLPNLAFTFDPNNEDLLKKSPLPKNTEFLTTQIKYLIFLVSSVTAILCIFVFIYASQKFDFVTAQTMVFAILCFKSLFSVFSCKALEKNIWEINIFNNPKLLMAFLAGIFLTIISFNLPILQNLLETTNLNFSNWMIVLSTSFLIVVIIEVSKLLGKLVGRK